MKILKLIITDSLKQKQFKSDLDTYFILWGKSINEIDENLLAFRNFVLNNNYQKIVANCEDNQFLDVNIYLKDLDVLIEKEN